MRWAVRRTRSASSPETPRVIRPEPARAAFGSMNSQARSSISQRVSSPTRLSGGRPKNRVYHSMLGSRSDTGTPANRWVIALISGRSLHRVVSFNQETAGTLRTHRWVGPGSHPADQYRSSFATRLLPSREGGNWPVKLLAAAERNRVKQIMQRQANALLLVAQRRREREP